MSVTLGLTDFAIMSGLRAFLLSVLPSTVEVIRGQDNRVAEPSSVDFVVMTSLMRGRISTNVSSYADPFPAAGGSEAVLQPTRVTIQLDVHGPNSTDNAQIIATLLRDDFACQAFAASTPGVQPLYSEEPRQVPFVNGEGQYEDRWTIDAVFQANAVVTVPQSFAGVVSVTLTEADSSATAVATKITEAT